MQNEFWLSMSSKNLEKAKEFFKKLGFTMNDKMSGPHMLSLFMGEKKTVLCIFPEATFQGFINNAVTSTSQSNEIIFSLSASSPEEVDEMAKKAVAAGGNLFGKPAYKHGWMYGCGFADLDGHRWNVLFMDMSKMPKQ